MTNRNILHYPANLNIDSLGNAQNAPEVPSFTDRDNDWGTESSFYPDYGDTGTQFMSNTSYGGVQDNYLVKAGNIWSSDQNQGWIVEKNSNELVQFNLRIYGSPGHWIPAPMLKGFCFQELYATSFNSNWRVRRLALSFRNYKTNSTRTYSPGWNFDKQAQNKYEFRNMSGQNHWDIIRSWGPDWVLYGAIFNYRSNGTSAVQRPKHHLFGVRVAWQTNGLTGSTRWMPFKKDSWSTFRDRLNNGTPEFQNW